MFNNDTTVSALGPSHLPRVLLFGPSLSAVSGVSTHLNQLIQSSLQDHYELKHFQVGSEGRKESPLTKFARWCFSPVSLITTILTTRTDIVHINTSFDHKAFWRDLTYLMLAKACGRKTVYQVHGGDFEDFLFRKPLRASLVRWALVHADAVVVLTPKEKAYCERFTHIDCLRVIPNAIDVKIYKTPNTKSYQKSFFHLVYIGRLELTKGVFDIVEAVNSLRNKAPGLDIKLSIAGSGSAYDNLVRHIAKFSLGDRIKMLGAVYGDAKIQLWQQADLFIFPSFHPEGLPYAVLESLASGTPMVTTRAGGIGDSIEEGKHGLFVPPRDPGMLAEAIRQLLENKDRLREMSAACYRHAERYYSIERLVMQFRNVYARTLKSQEAAAS